GQLTLVLTAALVLGGERGFKLRSSLACADQRPLLCCQLLHRGSGRRACRLECNRKLGALRLQALQLALLMCGRASLLLGERCQRALTLGVGRELGLQAADPLLQPL